MSVECFEQIHYKPDYETLHCDYCNGSIGIFERGVCCCQNCGKEFTLYKLTYDEIRINSKTGWIFPVVSKKE